MSSELLSVVAGDREITLEGKGRLTVGRDEDADLRVDDERVSGQHLVVSRSDSAWMLRDTSDSGTYADGQPLIETEISRPLIVRLGDAREGPVVQLVPLTRERAETQAVPTSMFAAPVEPPPRQRAEREKLGRMSAVHTALRTQFLIGRAADNDIVLDDLLVSRHHAEMHVRADGSWELADLDSPNGTFVNGRRITCAVLEELDLVTVGHHSFRLVGPQLELYVDEGAVSVEAVGLTVRAEGRVLLDDLSLSLDERSFLAVVGPSGSGKSTLVNALTGFRPAQQGAVRYDGRDLYREYDELRTRIGFVPQDDVVHYPLTVRQALTYAAELRFGADISAGDRDTRVTEVIGELGLEQAADTGVARLSGGQRRRVSVGIELITKPSLLFLDEPTSGLDPGYERELMRLLRELADGGRTVVVITHSVQSLRLCDRVLFLAPGGRPAYFGPVQLAPAYFGREDLQEVFQVLVEHADYDWPARFKEHRYYERYVTSRLTAAREPAPIERRSRLSSMPSPSSWFAQFAMLTRRYARVIAADRRNLLLLLLQPVVLGLIMLAALPANELRAPPPGELRVISKAGLVLLVVVLGATWLGASNAVREIVRELPILQRERAVGLTVSAYLASKTLVLGLLTIVQAALLALIALGRQGGPQEGSILGWPMGELILGAALAGLAGMALGLLISAVCRSVDRAMTILPVVLIVELLLALGGVFPDLVDKPVLKEASYAASTQWGFSATASTVDLDRLQSLDRLARDLPTIRRDDPLPVLRTLSEQGRGGERLWRHDWPTWALDAGALLLLTALFLLGSAAAVARRKPEA